MSKSKVALIGWSPDAFDYSTWPGLTKEQLKTQLEGDRDSLIALGYDAQLLYIFGADTAYDTVCKYLREKTFDCIMIGAGVRKVEANFLLFEKVVNAVHANAPHSKICFNSIPTDTADAIKRWV
ncbi:hypothetical protein ACO0LF_19270 [Undibacterium sp. Di27W]|uniref:hypothetical protein n=1 Tax=Undibacterium sp. Di27W TaxID=3413036 RepID=UPI003BF08D3C